MLSDTMKVEDQMNGHQGSWTMVYDEGFSVSVSNIDYFAFSKFYEEHGEHKSECSKTLVGWYHDWNNNQMGCYQGMKSDGSSQVNHELKHEYIV